jgi:mRNA-degrading endonuclease RelE of RelBE toxin-antitoxin system
VARYRILYSSAYVEDYKALEAFDRAKVRNGVLSLADQAEVPTRKRRRLRTPVLWCPEAAWKLRIEDYRVFYRVDDGVVLVLRVQFKGSRTIQEMGS